MYSYFKIYFYMSNFASIGRFDLVVVALAIAIQSDPHSWNNGKEVPRWEVAEIQTRSKRPIDAKFDI